MRKALVQLVMSRRFPAVLTGLVVASLAIRIVPGPGGLIQGLIAIPLYGYLISYAHEVATVVGGELPRLSDISAHVRRGLVVGLATIVPGYAVILVTELLLSPLAPVSPVAVVAATSALAVATPWIIIPRYVLFDRLPEAFHYIDCLRRSWLHRETLAPVLAVACTSAFGLTYARHLLMGLRASTLPHTAELLATGAFSQGSLVVLAGELAFTLVSTFSMLLAAGLFGRHAVVTCTTGPGAERGWPNPRIVSVTLPPVGFLTPVR